VRDFYLILNIVIAVALFVLGIVALVSNRKSLINKLFLAFTICVAIWLVAAAISNDTTNSPAVSLYGNYLVFLFSYFSGYLLLWFAVLITSMKRVAKSLKILTLPIIIVGLSSATPLVVAGVERQVDVYAISFGILIIPYAIVLIGQLVMAIIVLIVGRTSASGRNQAQITSVLQSLGIAIPILLITQFVLPLMTSSFAITDAGILIMALPVGALYFSVIRHGLFDIKLAAVRAVTYALSLISLGAIYYMLAYVTSILLLRINADTALSFGPVNIALAIILAFVFQPIKHFFDRVTNKLFYKDSYNVEEFFARLTKRLSIITNLDVLLRYSSSEISHTLKASFGAFYIHQIDKPSVFVATEKIKKLPTQDAEMLDKYVTDNYKDIIITDNLTIEDSQNIKRMLDSHHIALVLPMTKDSIIAGYLFLGDHLSSRYSHRDIQALLTIADELTIAIQNALSVQEIRALNESLQHRVDVATKELRSSNVMLMRLDKTKDDFISMASHQLRTPLTSIKGYISMVREGDAGKITKSQDQLLEEAFKSSERMVHLINDFLNLSRMQTGKFQIDKRPVDLAKVIEQELDNLATTADSHKLSFVYKAPKNFPILDLDEDKIRQVIMNFSDNAIYYSPEGTNIKVKLTVESKYAIFTVTDTGIGVPRAEQSQLFSKFYRASNARKQRPDGTGVGLYLAKTVIEAHGGKVIFESTENKGSTFGFKLPIEELRTRSDADNFDNKNNNR
jgi:signal transduction histidine kinase